MIKLTGVEIRPVLTSSQGGPSYIAAVDLARGTVIIEKEDNDEFVLQDIALIPFLRGLLYGIIASRLNDDAYFLLSLDGRDEVIRFNLSGGKIVFARSETVLGIRLEEARLALSEEEVFSAIRNVLVECRGFIEGDWARIFSDPLLKDLYGRLERLPRP
jgi:hypothetical protein